jgi:hypothetical protein
MVVKKPFPVGHQPSAISYQDTVVSLEQENELGSWPLIAES